MRLNKLYIILIIKSLIYISCIEEFTPEVDSQDANLYVVEGRVTDVDGFQSIFISKSTETTNMNRSPVGNCEVRIYDDNDNVFLAEEYPDGEYKVYINEEYLTYGTAFRAEVITPEGETLSSEFDTLRDCPEIDTVYYEIEDFVDEGPNNLIPGIQFYLDYNGKNSTTKRIKVEFEETWEYHSKYPLKWIWYGWWYGLEELSPADYSKMTCWKTTKTDRIYSFSTEKLSENVYNKFPLHHILNTSHKLLVGYSLLIKQYSISEEAMAYYEKINSNIINNGGLYNSQPQLIEGNITNISDPNKRVLGYFSVMGVKTKRIFINSVENFSLNVSPYCEPMLLDLGYGIIADPENPVYLWLENGAYRLNKVCIDCTVLGGETEKPEFWPY